MKRTSFRVLAAVLILSWSSRGELAFAQPDDTPTEPADESTEPADETSPDDRVPDKTSPPPQPQEDGAITPEGPAAGASTAAERGPGSDEPSAADVRGAPRPHQDISGIEGGQKGPPGYLWIPRVLLYPVRGALEVGMAPLRGLIYVEQKYAIRDRIAALFFTEDKRYGVYPVAGLEAGFGFNAGLRAVAKRPLGIPVEGKFAFNYGGRFSNLLRGTVEVAASDRVTLQALGLYEARPQDRFFGIGNTSPVDIEDVMMPIDALADPTAVSTRFSEDLVQAGLSTLVNLPGPWGGKFDVYYIRRRFGPQESAALSTAGNQPSIDAAFDTSTIPGFDDGVDYIYSEVELNLDTRRPATRFGSDPMPGTGWYLEGYAGLAETVNDDITHFIRYGIDAQRYIRLAQNPRTLVLRAHVEGVTGDLGEVPFTELPRLGGPILLRGYRRDRFRDRVRALATAEYQWDLSEQFAGFVFVDAGQVFREYSDFEIGDTRIGFGGGLQMHSRTSYLGRLLIGTSTDGSFLINLAFDPAFDIQSRTLRK